MALQDLTLLTIAFEFVPPLVASLMYLVFFRRRRSRFIEAFIILMYLMTATYFLLGIYLAPPTVPIGFNPVVDTRVLSWLLLIDMISQFVVALQEYMTWVMVSFFAVLFGMLVLAAKLALQDPMKMRFKNLIRRVTHHEPESDGYSGFRDRIDNITLEGVAPQPLNPEVQARAWKEAWKDYLIIGLATLIPSISVYIGSLPQFVHGVARDDYIVNILIFLTWIYRFGYPASNRIAKGAGLRLGNRDIGGEMMHGVLGWFFRLNIIITFGVIGLQAYQLITLGYANIADILLAYYQYGLILAVPPILLAILILPLVENFAVVLYKKVFDGIYHARSKISQINLGGASKNIGSSLGTGLVVTAAFAASVFATTLNYSMQHGLFLIFPRNVDNEFIAGVLESPLSNGQMIGETIWILLILVIPFAMIILLGIIGRYVRERIKGGVESFALVSGFTLSVLTYYLFPGMDYIVAFGVTPAEYAGGVFNRLRPIPILPQPSQWLARLAFQFIVNLPILIFSTLFILYFFKYRESWRETIGETAGPLLNIHKEDLVESIVMFFGGLIVAILGVWVTSIVIANPDLVANLLQGLLIKIGQPDGLEGVLPPPGNFLDMANPFGWFVVFAEHNMVRVLLMLVIGPIFWAAVLWFARVEKTRAEKMVGNGTLVALAIGISASLVWTTIDARNGLFNPNDPRWGFVTQLGIRALVLFGGLFLICSLIAIANRIRGRGSGAWWLPLFVFIFAAEYFVYDDQFTLIALVALPVLVAGGYRLIGGGQGENFHITYIKFSLMSLAIAEVLSTALTIGGIAIIEMSWGLGILEFLAQIIPHAIIEIPTFLVAAGASIRIAKDLWPTIESKDWASLPSKTRALLGDERTWRTYVLIVFFLVIAALVEAFITPIVFLMAPAP